MYVCDVCVCVCMCESVMCESVMCESVCVCQWGVCVCFFLPHNTFVVSAGEPSNSVLLPASPQQIWTSAAMGRSSH